MNMKSSILFIIKAAIVATAVLAISNRTLPGNNATN